MSDQGRTGNETTREREHRLRFAVRKAIRYHDHRRSFYLKVEPWIAFAGLVLGSGAAVNAVSSPGAGWFGWAALVFIAALSVAALVIGASRKAALDSSLYSRFARLERRFLRSLSYG